MHEIMSSPRRLFLLIPFLSFLLLGEDFCHLIMKWEWVKVYEWERLQIVFAYERVQIFTRNKLLLTYLKLKADLFQAILILSFFSNEILLSHPMQNQIKILIKIIFTSTDVYICIECVHLHREISTGVPGIIWITI